MITAEQSHMSRTVLTAFAGIALLASTGCADLRFSLKWKNKLAPDFELAALDGTKVKLSGFRGTPVLLSFWGFG